MIKRDLLLGKIIDYKDKDIIKIITGMRRKEKSFLLKSIIEIFNVNIYNYYARFREIR